MSQKILELLLLLPGDMVKGSTIWSLHVRDLIDNVLLKFGHVVSVST